MWVFGVRLPADSDTPGGGDATIESEGLAGWTEDFDRALATASTSVPVSQATLVAYKCVGLSLGYCWPMTRC